MVKPSDLHKITQHNIKVYNNYALQGQVINTKPKVEDQTKTNSNLETSNQNKQHVDICK